MDCVWCDISFPGWILAEEVCLACIVEDVVPDDFEVKE